MPHPTLQVLQALSRHAGPVAAGHLARETGIPRASLYRALHDLREAGFVTHLPEERQWLLGVAAFELGFAFSRQESLQRLGRPVVRRMVDTASQNGHLAVLHGTDVLYLVEERAPRRPTLMTDVGVRMPAPWTASGLAMLAGLPRHQVRALFPDATAFVPPREASAKPVPTEANAWERSAPRFPTTRPPKTRPNSPISPAPTTPGQLRRALQTVRAAGVAREDGSVAPGLASVAAMVPDAAGQPVASVALTYEGERATADELDLIEAEVRRAASELAARLR